MTRQVFLVVPAEDGKWRVEFEGGGQTGRMFADKDEAFRHAKDQAQAAQLAHVIVHGHDGQIQYENTYGEDPHQRKG
jgi:hypothetical protein